VVEMGLGPVGFGFFMEVKHLLSTTPRAKIFSKSSWIEMEVNGGHWGDRTLNRTRSQHDQTHPACSSRMLRTRASARPVTCGTSASGQAPEGQQTQRVDRTRWRVRSCCLLESTGRWHYGVWSIQAARLVT
jgi:hypothetical protein